MKSALIIGGDSTLGTVLMKEFSARGIEATATSRRSNSKHLHVDLAASPASWAALPPAEVAYICAASTKLDECEKHPDETKKINVTHMQELAKRLQSNGSHVIFLSTNQVFDGEKSYRKTSEPPSPKNEYGRQKAAFEAWLSAHPSASVLRLTKVVAAPLPMLAHWEVALKDNKKIEAFDDLRFAPLTLDATIAALLELGMQKRDGVSHLSGTRDISYYEIAQLLARKLGKDSSLVTPISATTKGIPPQFLPKHGTLESSVFAGVSVPEPEQIIL